jgi:hypothetical protein
MSNVVKYETATGNVKDYLLSVNTPDYESPQPPYSFLISPDVSALASVPLKYWKVSGEVVVEMTAGEKAAIDLAEDLARPAISFPIYSVTHNNMVQCDNADWPINRAVTVLNDPLKTSIKVIQLDNGVASGIGSSLVFPSGTTCILTEAIGRSSITPDTADRTLLFQIRFRVIPYGEAINSWQLNNFSSVVVPQNIYCNKFSWLTKIGAGVLDNKLIQIVFARRATDTLPNPFYLERVHFKFS